MPSLGRTLYDVAHLRRVKAVSTQGTLPEWASSHQTGGTGDHERTKIPLAVIETDSGQSLRVARLGNFAKMLLMPDRRLLHSKLSQCDNGDGETAITDKTLLQNLVCGFSISDVTPSKVCLLRFACVHTALGFFYMLESSPNHNTEEKQVHLEILKAKPITRLKIKYYQ